MGWSKKDKMCTKNGNKFKYLKNRKKKKFYNEHVSLLYKLLFTYKEINTIVSMSYYIYIYI